MGSAVIKRALNKCKTSDLDDLGINDADILQVLVFHKFFFELLSTLSYVLGDVEFVDWKERDFIGFKRWHFSLQKLHQQNIHMCLDSFLNFLIVLD